MKKKLLTLLVLVFTIFGLASCKTDKPSTDGNQNQGETKPETGDKVAKSYSYAFKSGDFKTSGGTTAKLGGLVWDYESIKYIGFDATKGIQFGSSKNPQSTPLNIVADFKEEVIIQNFALELAVGSGGSSKYTVSFDNGYTKSEDFKNTGVEQKVTMDLNETTNHFKLTLQANEKALYIKSVSFTCLVDKNSNLEFDQSGSEVKPDELPTPKYDLVTIDEYYKGFNLNLSGSDLRKELDTKNDLKTKYNYGDSRYILQYTDESLTDKNKVYGIYDAKLIDKKWQNGQTWNREHVWACNHMTHTGDRDLNNSTVDHKSDLHNLRASTNSVNSSRGDKYFSINKTGADYYNPNAVAPSGHDFRGDVARILLYMYVQYDFLFLNDNPNQNLDFSMGLLTELLAWHEEDKVDAFEVQRNNRIYEYQGNRNPFIDHPELANRLF